MTNPAQLSPDREPVVLRNPAQPAEVPDPPRHPSGRLWTLEMIYGEGAWRAYADTPTALVEALGVADYRTRSAPTDRARARLELACRIQVRLQAGMVVASDLDGCTPEQRDLLTGSRADPPRLGHWAAAPPLVLVRDFYAPTTPLPAPTGNLIWLDAGDDWALLDSLAAAGVIALATSTPIPDDTGPASPPTEPGADDGRR